MPRIEAGEKVVVERVARVYIGKPGKCFCGCSCRYIETDTKDPNELREAVRIIKAIRAVPLIERDQDEVYSAIDKKTVVYAAYFKSPEVAQ